MAVAGLVLGILSIVTGFVCIGIIFGIIGFILSLIARIRNRSGMAIAGIVCSVIGIFISIVMIAGIGHISTIKKGGLKQSTNSVVTSSSVADSKNVSSTSVNHESSTSVDVDNTNLADLMDATLYMGKSQYVDVGYAALYVKNTSDKDVRIDVTFTEKDSSGNAIGSSSDSEACVAAGQDVLLLGYFDTYKDDATCDYSMKVNETTGLKSMRDSIDLTSNTTDENIVFTATNKADKDAYNVSVKAIFLKDNKIVSTDHTYLQNDSDFALNPGQTLSGEIDIPYNTEYDNVIYTYTAQDNFF